MSEESVSLEIEFIEKRRFRKRVTMCGAGASFVIKSPDEFQSEIAVMATPGETTELSREFTIDTVEVIP